MYISWSPSVRSGEGSVNFSSVSDGRGEVGMPSIASPPMIFSQNPPERSKPEPKTEPVSA